jgi:ubiquitin-conjugating enzyme E2 Q
MFDGDVKDTKDAYDLTLSNCTYTGSNSIIPEWKQKESLVRFVVEYGFITLKSSRCANIFKCVPATWTNRGIMVENAIKELDIQTDLEKIFHAMVISRDDEELLRLIGAETYGFIKFLLHMNQAIYIEKCNLIYESLTDGASSSVSYVNSVVGAGVVSSAGAAARYKQFKMTYAPYIEARLKDRKTVFLFHGTPTENIVPIIATGLRNCSRNDELRLNGAAHGEGIYLSNSAEFSLGYCRVVSSTLAMLVYEVIDDPKWFKTANIYVVDDESALVLRYVIVITNYNSSLDGFVFKKLTSTMKGEALREAEAKKENAKMAVMNKAFNKRLMIEYKKLMCKPADELGFIVRLAEEGNLRVWTVCITGGKGCLGNPELEAQMARLGIPFLELEISFPEGYPIDPPFPRVVYPRFKSLTGHITAGGSICMEAISKSGWVPTTNMEALIIQIKLALVDGKAHLDESHIGMRYNAAEAKEAFERAMAKHGWA